MRARLDETPILRPVGLEKIFSTGKSRTFARKEGFQGVPSFDPARGKTAVAFHAKDDLPEVRREVFQLLLAHPVKFYAVVRDKHEVVGEVRRRNARDTSYRYNQNELYDRLVEKLFQDRLHKGCRRPRSAGMKRALVVTMCQSAA